MKRMVTLVAALVSSAAAVGACSGDDTVGALDAGPPATDASALDSTTPDASTTDSATTDGSTTPDGDADAAVGPTRLLLSYNGSSTSELVAFGVASKHVDGDLIYPGSLGTTSTASPAPYLLEQEVDVVARLDRSRPWVIDSSWNVALNDAVDGGDSVHRFDDGRRHRGDEGVRAPQHAQRDRRHQSLPDRGRRRAHRKPIDLSSMVQAADEDGVVEMTAGAYLPSTGILYVLLGNILTASTSRATATSSSAPRRRATIIGIDTTTNLPVMLAGGNAVRGRSRLGMATIRSSAQAGWRTTAASRSLHRFSKTAATRRRQTPGAGPIQQRRIRSDCTLATGAVTTLLDASAMGFPGAFTYVDATHAFVQFSAPDFSSTSTYLWDPTQTTIGATVMNAPDSWVYDGAGNLLGITTVYATDGGSEIDVVSVRVSDGTVTTLGVNPFTLSSGYLGGVDIWPHP